MMKKYVKGGRFEDQVWLVNQYDEKVVQLEYDGYGYYQLPKGFRLDTLDIGDVYKVIEVESEVY